MVAAQLPEAPDFAAIELRAPPFAERQQHILMLIGNLGVSWSNNESMFIYVLMLLLEVSEVDAAIVFATLNTTRARLDLVRRLAAIKITDLALARTLSRLIRKFDSTTKLRNEFNHCMYHLNMQGEITHTHLMRPQEGGGQFSLGEIRELDERRIGEIEANVRLLKRLNRELWDFLPGLREHMKARAGQAGRS